MRADVSLRGAAYAAAPLALAAGWRTARQVARSCRATIMHGHWVVPGGVLAAAACPALPLVVSLHGSDVYVAEKLGPARRAARAVFRRAGVVTACSSDLGRRAVALGADPGRIVVVPYGVDVERFRPDGERRACLRRRLGVSDDRVVVLDLCTDASRLRLVKNGRKRPVEGLQRAKGRVTLNSGGTNAWKVTDYTTLEEPC